MNVSELSLLLTSDRTVRLLDVRTPGEFENAHVAGAYNVPLDQLHEHAGEVRAATGTIVLVCQSGSRAQRAEALLQQSGMANVHVLDGGMNAWLAAGLEVRRVRSHISLERQVRMLAGAIVTLGAIAALTLSSWFAIVPALIGSGLVFAGVTDTCGMGMMLARLPYNQGARTCDTETIVRRFLADGERVRS